MKFLCAPIPDPADPVSGFGGLRHSLSEAPADPGGVIEVKRSPAEKATAKLGAFRRDLGPEESRLRSRPVYPG